MCFFYMCVPVFWLMKANFNIEQIWKSGNEYHFVNALTQYSITFFFSPFDIDIIVIFPACTHVESQQILEEQQKTTLLWVKFYSTFIILLTSTDRYRSKESKALKWMGSSGCECWTGVSVCNINNLYAWLAIKKVNICTLQYKSIKRLQQESNAPLDE